MKAAACQENAASWNSKRTALDVKLEVATAYTTVLRAMHAVEVAASTVASLAAHEKVVATMLNQGSVPKNDLLAAQVSLADARQQEIRARNQLAVAKAAYNRLVGATRNILGAPAALGSTRPAAEGRTAALGPLPDSSWSITTLNSSNGLAPLR